MTCIVGTDATPPDIAKVLRKLLAAANKATMTKKGPNDFATQTHMGRNLTPPGGIALDGNDPKSPRHKGCFGHVTAFHGMTGNSPPFSPPMRRARPR